MLYAGTKLAVEMNEEQVIPAFKDLKVALSEHIINTSHTTSFNYSCDKCLKEISRRLKWRDLTSAEKMKRCLLGRKSVESMWGLRWEFMQQHEPRPRRGRVLSNFCFVARES